MTKQDLLEHLRSSEHFDDAFKNLWISKIETEGLTSEILHDLKIAVAEQITQNYKALGVEEDQNDPEYKAEEKKMLDELQKIDNELESGMTALQEESNQVFQKTVKQMEDDQAQALRDSM